MTLQLTKSFLLLFLLTAVLLVVGRQIGQHDGLLVGAILALSIISFLLYHGEIRLLPRFNTKLITGQDPWGLKKMLIDLCEKSRMPVAALYLIEHPAPQAFATGRTYRSGKIFVTTGLIDKFTPDEIRAILAYHISCIRHRYVLAFTIASALADSILSIGQTIDWFVNWLIGGNNRHDTVKFSLMTRLVSPFANLVVSFAVGRKPFFRADTEGSMLTSKPEILAQALWKLESYSLTQPFQIHPATSHFFIVNPLTKNPLARYFYVQPEVSDRIRNLVGHYPI